MKEQFDKNLANKIKNTLLEHEEPYEVGAWENFKKKKNEPRGYIWTISLGLAATIAFAFVFSPIIMQQLNNQQINDSEIVMTTQAEADSGYLNRLELVTDSSTLASSSTALADDSSSVLPMLGSGAGNAKIAKNQHKTTHEIPQDDLNVTIVGQVPPPPVASQSTEVPLTTNETIILAKADTNSQYTEIPKTFSAPNEQNIAEADEKPLRLYKDSVMNEIFTNPALAIIDDKQKKNNIKWGVMFSSGMNYSDAQTNSSLNLGGGFTTEIPLTKKLDLFAGVAVARQSVLVDQHNNQNTMLLSGRQLMETTANLVWLDIPVNIQYNLTEKQNNNLYVSAGLSSGTFLREEYEQLYQVQSVAFETTVADGLMKQVPNRTVTNEVENETEESASSFGVGRILNIAFGMEYILQKNLGVVVEPYFRYPLGNLTSRDLSYSTGGINLRIQLSGK